MLLRLLLIASALTSASLVGTAWGTVTSAATGSDTLDPVASCAPTRPSDEDDDDAEDDKKRSAVSRFA